ncbi:extracellular solute-binding protein [Paenibacillus eucommiae]|uniref:N-acetylglucosamine transport system substrate-binding protein n=1 Tax=Paenibacillus eucommiae TaxID=1355755 RepID=A0ABS4J3F8_9BACL|nr:extracellular solute-binding protein [Paenibacillus eucommiae]MBP1993820.1 N-acetylglucosamine transport system substrate-binding protein [Paenibacillus eucommiae]
MKHSAKMGRLTLLWVMLALVLAACSKESEPSTFNEGSEEPEVYAENGLPKHEKVKLKFAYWENGNGREWIDYAMETFTQKFPNVSFETTYSPKIGIVIQTKIAVNNDEDMFDIFSNVISNEANADVSINLAKEKKIEPLDDLWEHKLYDRDSKTLREVQSGIIDGTPTLLGKVYEIPYGQSISGLFFNKSLFEENGWNQEPKTWTEFIALIDHIRAANMIPITYPGKYPFYLQFALGTAQLFGAAEIRGNLEKFNEDYRRNKLPFYMSKESMDIYNRIYELGKKNAFPDEVAALSHTQSQMQLLQGQAAMAATGEWVQNEMKDSIPARFRWGFMLVPLSDNPESTKYYNLHTSSGYYIWAAKPELNKKWAKEFIVWLWNQDVQWEIMEKAGALPIRNDIMNDEALLGNLMDASKAIVAYMKKNPVKGIGEKRSVILTDPNADKATKLMEDALIDISAGKQDPLPVLQEAEKLLQKAIEAQK